MSNDITLNHKAVRLNVATVTPFVYLTVIAAVEMISLLFGALPSVIMHAALIPFLLSHYALHASNPYRRILPILALVPLLRLLSLTIPLPEIPPIYWQVMIEIPLLVAIVLVMRLLGLSAHTVGLRKADWRQQTIIALSGLPFGVGAYLILRPQMVNLELGWGNIALAPLILLSFSALVEELLFRGLLQGVASETLGRASVLFSTVLSTSMYSGWVSFSYILFVGLVGFYFGWSINRTHSVWGAVLAHSFISIGVAFIWPRVDALLQYQLFSLITGIVELVGWLLFALGLGLIALYLLRRLTWVVKG